MDSWHYDDTAEEDTEIDNKFFGGKDAIIFLIDAASPEMHQVPDPESTDTRLQVRSELKFYMKIVKQNHLFFVLGGIEVCSHNSEEKNSRISK